MELLNLLEVKTVFGPRQFKLMKGDISKIDFPIDLLCVSAFKNGYNPIPNTLLGALHENRNIDLRILTPDPALNFTKSDAAFFVKIKDDNCIKNILCLHILGTDRTLEESFDELFSTIYKAELRGHSYSQIMMPLLGTGRQGINPSKVLEFLLKKTEHVLRTSLSIRQIYLVAFNDNEAEKLNNGMNTLLGRSDSVFQKTDLVSSVSESIRNILEKRKMSLNSETFSELISVLNNNEVNSFHFALVSRKVCEYILQEYTSDVRNADLLKRIRNYSLQSRPPWIVSYFHMIRTFGNAFAHDNSKYGSNTLIVSQDLAIAMFSLERILLYYFNTMDDC